MGTTRKRLVKIVISQERTLQYSITIKIKETFYYEDETILIIYTSKSHSYSPVNAKQELLDKTRGVLPVKYLSERIILFPLLNFLKSVYPGMYLM
ncbi:hypothetical protein MXB_428 [Myxobolus squamalis]|nr:hypothetical protein MXB_428 [Myxobolus squamalis]